MWLMLMMIGERRRCGEIGCDLSYLATWRLMIKVVCASCCEGKIVALGVAEGAR